MKMNKRNMAMSIFWVLLGTILMTLSLMGRIATIWNSMGTAFICLGIVQLVRQIRYRTNESYREKIDIASKDERNSFLANRAWAWAGSCYVILSGIAVVILLILNRPEARIISCNVCLMLILYWVCYLFLSRKY